MKQFAATGLSYRKLDIFYTWLCVWLLVVGWLIAAVLTL